MADSPRPDPGEALRATVREPGSIWCFSCLEGLADGLPPPHAPFRWLHLNLADQRSLRWLEREAGLPPALLAFIEAADATPRIVTAPGGVGFTIQDFERDLESAGLGEIAPLHVVLVDGLLVTGRRRPLRGADLIRRRLAEGADVSNDAAALGFLLATLIDGFAAILLDLSGELLEAESELMADERPPDARRLVTVRRRTAQLHKLVGTLRTLLQRMEADHAVPQRFAGIPHALLPRLAALEADILAAQSQLRLIREELDLQVSQRTNENVYLLSIITALAMPATLVTGFFGMNTGGLPFAAGHGTVFAFLCMIVSALGTYLLLRRMGLIRTR